MSGPHPQSHVTHRPSGFVTNQRCYNSTFTRPMDPKLSRVVTQDERTPPTKSRDKSNKWSRDKSKIFYLYFHKAQGPQTQQSGNYNNEKTSRHMSCPQLRRHVGHILAGCLYGRNISIGGLSKQNKIILCLCKVCSISPEQTCSEQRDKNKFNFLLI